jgi:hypothetical protein
LNALRTWMRGDSRTRLNGRVVLVLVCLTLLALLTFVQVVHVHSVSTDADHCPLCIVIHSAAPIAAAAAAAVIVVQIEALSPVFEVRPIRTVWHRSLFIRPPPEASPVSF